MNSQAKKIRAINTLVRKGDSFSGYNTDSIGALDAIEKKVSISGKKILLLGAGGAAKAIIFEALQRGALVTIFNRNKDKARVIATEHGCHYSEIPIKEYDICINATPLGQSSDDPLPLDLQYILRNRLVMDLITTPIRTAFLQAAEKKGCTTIPGYQMFIYQALEQFALWFGAKIKRDQALRVLES